MQKTFKRVLAIALSSVMAASAFAVSASAYNKDYQSETHTVFRHTEQTLAPGVSYYNNYAYSSDGKQMVYYVATAEIDRDDVRVQGSYLNSQTEVKGMSKLSEQVASANSKFSDPNDEDFVSEDFTVVAGTNGDFYNMQTGQPSGAFAINGKIMNNANNRPWFAVFEDGTATCGNNNADYEAAIAEHGAVQNSVGGSQLLVKDGQDVTANASGSYNTDRHSRTMIGVTADNKVVCAVLDGRQEPFSCGGTMHELAQIMLEAECEIAINLDGGGSTTFGARPEGEDSFKILNRPSDGSERSISSGVIIASTAKASNAFDHVTMTVDDEYVTPGTDTKINVAGVSASGSSAEIPDGITYEVTGGTVAGDTFTAGNAAGEATITAKYNGEAVGSATVNVVVPDSIEFSSDNYTIPYSKSADLNIIAKKGLNEVKSKASDYTFTFENPDAGTMNGFTYTAGAESDIASTSVTAALNGTELTAQAGISFGKGSEVVYDFEDGTTNGFNLSYSNYNYYLPKSKVFVADKENGKVHSGNYALGLNIDYSNSQESGYQMIALYHGKVSGNVDYYEGAVNMGTWLYIPDEYVGLWVRWTVAPITAVTEDAETGDKSYTLGSVNSNTMDGGAGGTGVVYSFDEPGWHYLSCDLSSYKGFAFRDYYYDMQFYISDRDGTAYGYYAKDAHNINGNFTVYMDDVTVDFSTVVEDREAPIFEKVILGDDGPNSNEGMTLENGYVSDGYNKIDLSARVAENTAKSNYSGLDESTAQAYVDGNAVNTNYANGILSVADSYEFCEGKHTVKFVICDKAGNRASITRNFSVTNVSRKEFIKVVAHDTSLDRVLHGSLYWVDVVSTATEKTSKVVTTLNLDSMSTWELDHMTVADGFEASYKVVDAADKVVELTIEHNGSNLTGEQVLVSIPVRTWEMDNMTKYNRLSDKNWNYAEFKASNEFWPVAVEVRVQQGLAYYEGSRRFFTGDNVFCWTESWANNANMVKTAEGQAYKAAWNGGHDHRPAYANYYADGTTNYVEPRVSKEAKEPTCTEDGWTEELFCDECNSVVKWSEVVPATGHDYKFSVEKGGVVCTKCDAIDTEFTGMVTEDGKNYYVKLGVLTGGWFDVDGDWYYFDPDTKEGVNGEVRLTDGVKFDFENGKLLSGKWVNTKDGTKYYYGPSCYKNGWQTIDGERYAFDYNGVMYYGVACIHYSNNAPQEYLLDENGAYIQDLNDTGVVKATNGVFYCVNGVGQKAGVVQDDEGNFYYINSTYAAVKNCTYGISAAKTNGLVPAGTYEFDANGVMLNPPQPEEPTEEPTTAEPETQPATGEPEIKNGLSFDDDGAIRYYVNGEPTYAGVVQDAQGNFYYINSSKKAVKSTSYTIGAARTNGLVPAGKYDFDANGVMTNPPQVEPTTEPATEPATDPVVLNGLIADEKGDLYYYVDGVLTYAGLIEIDGDYYYINSAKKAVRNCTYGISAAKTNGLMPAGTYEFGDDGKMILPEPQDEPVVDGLSFDADGEIRYYVNGQPTYAGVVTDGEGNYYYINSSMKAVKNTTYSIGAARTNGLIPAGRYDIAPDGKIILPVAN